MGLNSLNFQAFAVAAFEVGQHLKRAYGVARCGMFFEGYKIGYKHVIMVPVHEEKLLFDGRANPLGHPGEYQDIYPGCLTT